MIKHKIYIVNFCTVKIGFLLSYTMVTETKFTVLYNHRIIGDRMENSIKGIRIWHCGFAASIILFSTPT